MTEPLKRSEMTTEQKDAQIARMVEKCKWLNQLGRDAESETNELSHDRRQMFIKRAKHHDYKKHQRVSV